MLLLLRLWPLGLLRLLSLRLLPLPLLRGRLSVLLPLCLWPLLLRAFRSTLLLLRSPFVLLLFLLIALSVVLRLYGYHCSEKHEDGRSTGCYYGFHGDCLP
jgi:hypothetical protein